MRSASILIVALATLVIGVLVWIGTTGDEGDIAEPLAAPGGADDAEAALPLPPRDPLEEADDALRRAPATAGPGRGSPTSEALTDLARGGIRILVLEGDGDTPVPHAEVRVRRHLGSLGVPTEFAEPEPEAEDEPWIPCDEDGSLVIAGTHDRIEIAGRAEDLWGRLEFVPGDAEPVRLRLFPDLRVLARVVDEAGTPRAGVPVALGHRGRWHIQASVVETRWPDGIAELRHIQETLRADGDWRTFVALALPLPEPVVVPFDPDDLPEEPLELVLPSTGTLEVELLGPDALPFAYPANVAIAALDPAVSAEARGGRPAYLGKWTEVASTPAGLAVFPLVPLDLLLAVRARSQAGFEATMLRHPGPRAPGERVRLALRLETTRVILVGRLVDEEGEPLRSIQFRLSGGTRFSSFDRGFATDANGRFHAPFPSGYLSASSSLHFGHHPAGGEETLRGSVASPTSPALGILELGDVFLVPSPLLAAGTVVDGEGDPIPKAVVHAVKAVDYEEHGWVNRISGLSAACDPEGRFTLTGWHDSPTLSLLPEHGAYPDPDHFPQIHEVPTGSADVILVLPAAGGLAGNMLLDEAVPPAAIRVTPVLPGHRARFSSDDPEVAADGSFAFPNLAPGTYSVVFNLNFFDPFLEVEGIVVRSGETNRDPRLQDVDLRERLHAYRLRVVDPQDEPVHNYYFHARPTADRGGPAKWKTVSRLGSILVTLHRSIDVRVTAWGYRPRVLLDVHSDETVVLEHGLPIRLVLSDPEVLLGTEATLEAWLDREGRRERGRASFSERGEVRLTVSDPGAYRIALYASAPTRLARIERPEATILQVEELPTEQVFTIPLTAEELREALERNRDG